MLTSKEKAAIKGRGGRMRQRAEKKLLPSDIRTTYLGKDDAGVDIYVSVHAPSGESAEGERSEDAVRKLNRRARVYPERF